MACVLDRALGALAEIASRAIVTDPKVEKAREFYANFFPASDGVMPVHHNEVGGAMDQHAVTVLRCNFKAELIRPAGALVGEERLHKAARLGWI